MDKSRISDEMLSAHVDGQLSAEDSEAVLRLALSDAEVAARLDGIRRTKDLLCHAYRTPPAPVRAGRADERPRFQAIRLAAAVTLIAIVGAASWFAGQRSGANAVIDDYVVRSDWVLPSARAEDERQQIVLHLASDDPAEMERSLDQAELILAGFEYNANAPEVELIANGDGLALFRSGVTPFAERIVDLQHDYPSLRLFACARTLERLALQGVDVALLPGVDTGSIAIERIYTRVRQGWSYEEI